MNPRRVVLQLLLAMLLAIGLPSHADAAPTVPQAATLEVMVLHATQTPGAGSIEPSIGNMPQLQQPPFSAWNTYRLLAKQSLTLQRGAPSSYTLPNGRILQITLEDITAGPRFKIAAAINQPGGNNAYLKLLEVTAPPNQTFFVAGQQFQGGVLIIGFTLH